MATAWSSPTTTLAQGVRRWETKHPGRTGSEAIENSLPISFTRLGSEVNTNQIYRDSMDWVQKPNCYKCPPADFDPWRWVVRLHTRNLRDDSKAQANKKLDTTWEAATAWFAGAAHLDGDRGQYFMTAAHNVVAFVKQVNQNGVVTNGEDARKAHVPCDAALIVASWGSSVFTGWVDRVAVMDSYYKNVHEGRSDAAALHVVNSSIPPEFYRGVAPVMVQLPAPDVNQPDLEYAFRCAVSGYPGAVNEFPTLNGLYVCGARIEDIGVNQGVGNNLVGSGWDRYTTDKRTTGQNRVIVNGVINVKRKSSKSAYGAVAFGMGNADGVIDMEYAQTTRGISGGPGVVFIPGPNDLVDGKPFVVGSLHGAGIVSSFNNTRGNRSAQQIGADPVLLLLEVGAAAGLAWKNTQLMPNNSMYSYVSR